MTLLGAVCSMSPDQQIQICSRGGTRHWFVGTAGEYMELWKELDELTHAQAKRAMQSAKRTWESRKTWMDWNEYLSYHTERARKEGKFAPPKLDYDEYVRNAKHRRYVAEKRYRERKEWYENYIKPSERDVVDSYRSLLHPDTIILAVKGREWGGFWSIDERDPRGLPYAFGSSTKWREDDGKHE